NYPGLEARVYGSKGALICRLVEEGSPGFRFRTSRRIEAVRNVDLAELHLVGRGGLERFTHAVLFDQAADQRALAAIHARLEAGIVPHGHEAGLDGPDGAALEF